MSKEEIESVVDFDFADTEIKRDTFKLQLKHNGKLALFKDGTPMYVEVYGQYAGDAKFSVKDALKGKTVKNKDDIPEIISAYMSEFNDNRAKQLVKDFKFLYAGKVTTKEDMPVEEFLIKFPWLEEEILEASNNLSNFTQI